MGRRACWRGGEERRTDLDHAEAGVEHPVDRLRSKRTGGKGLGYRRRTPTRWGGRCCRMQWEGEMRAGGLRSAARLGVLVEARGEAQRAAHFLAPQSHLRGVW